MQLSWILMPEIPMLMVWSLNLALYAFPAWSGRNECCGNAEAVCRLRNHRTDFDGTEFAYGWFFMELPSKPRWTVVTDSVEWNSSTQNAFSSWVAILLPCQKLHKHSPSLDLRHFSRMLQNSPWSSSNGVRLISVGRLVLVFVNNLKPLRSLMFTLYTSVTTAGFRFEIRILNFQKSCEDRGFVTVLVMVWSSIQEVYCLYL
jgi:hypothetical protein